MAYLNCPYCPAQGFPAPADDKVLELGFGLQKFRCISKHEFYVEKEDDTNEGHRSVRGVHED